MIIIIIIYRLFLSIFCPGRVLFSYGSTLWLHAYNKTSNSCRPPIAAGCKDHKKLYSICHEDVYNFSIFSCAGWRDVWDGVVNVYYTLFLFMESEVDDGGLGILDMNNPIHVWSLHYVFLARINRDLQDFRYRWNHHGIRTEGNLSPVQLFLIRTMELRNSNLTVLWTFRHQFGIKYRC